MRCHIVDPEFSRIFRSGLKEILDNSKSSQWKLNRNTKLLEEKHTTLSNNEEILVNITSLIYSIKELEETMDNIYKLNTELHIDSKVNHIISDMKNSISKISDKIHE